MKKKTILSLILCAAMMITCTCGNSKDKERFTPEVNETTGGEVEDVSGVAAYITANAPIADNWQEMFEKEINSTYGEKISKVEYLEGDLYTAYVIKDGKEVPYVTVNARTGYFHG